MTWPQPHGNSLPETVFEFERKMSILYLNENTPTPGDGEKLNSYPSPNAWTIRANLSYFLRQSG